MTSNDSIYRVRTVGDIGRAALRARKHSGFDQATAAGLSGVGTRFLGELERGKETLRIGLVLKVLGRLGLELWLVPRGCSIIDGSGERG